VVAGEWLLVVLREPVLLAGLVNLLAKIGGTRRSISTRSLEHGRKVSVAVVKSVLVLRLFDRCRSARTERRVVLSR
jgi:hypothetical protein